MSSLWTPGGEVPIDPDRGAPGSATSEPDAGHSDLDEEALRDQFEAMQQQLVEMPAAEVIAREAAAIYELAVLHLSQEEPRLPEARLAIDTLAAIIDGVGDRLGPAGEEFARVLPQLRLAYVERSES